MATLPSEFDFYLSGGGGNSDPLLSFGGSKSATKIEELESTITANTGPDRRIFFDSARIGDGDGAHVHKWVLRMDSTLDALRVIDFRSSDGRFVLEGRLTNSGSIGDPYRLFALDSLLHEVSALECANGHTDYRLLYFQNNGPETVENLGIYLDLIGIGSAVSGVGFELWSDDVSNPVEGTPADELTKPAGTDGQSDFTEALAFLGIERQPTERATGRTMSATSFRNLYIRRLVPANARRQPHAVARIVVEFTDGAAQQIRSGVLLPFGLLGFTPLVTISRDRGPLLTEQQIADGYGSAVRIGHGARYSALVKAAETGLPVPALEVGWALSGPGQLYTDEAPITDADGVSTVTYSAPSETAKTRQTPALGTETLHPVDATQNFKTSGSFSHTVAAGTERVLLVRVVAADSSDPTGDPNTYSHVSTCTFNGVAMTRIIQAASVSGFLQSFFLLVDPPIGAGTVAFTFPGEVVGFGAVATDLTGVDQTQPLDVQPVNQVIENIGVSTAAESITTETDGAFFWGFLCSAHVPDPIIGRGAGQVLRAVTIAGLVPVTATSSGETKPALVAGVHSMDWSSLDIGSDFLVTLLAFRPALTPATLTAKV